MCPKKYFKKKHSPKSLPKKICKNLPIETVEIFQKICPKICQEAYQKICPKSLENHGTGSTALVDWPDCSTLHTHGMGK